MNYVVKRLILLIIIILILLIIIILIVLITKIRLNLIIDLTIFLGLKDLIIPKYGKNNYIMVNSAIIAI